ncbi:MAG: AtpZ/AtpI family protein [Anaerolineae bacterium]|nr:AtpZ/AtpI family protein [Anaerolineae bacterium]
MSPTNPGKTKHKQQVINVVLAVAVGQVGFLTLVIVLGSVLLGFWLDNRLDTKPIMTLVLLIASIPVSVLTMLYVVRKTVARINTEVSQPKIEREEEKPSIDAND